MCHKKEHRKTLRIAGNPELILGLMSVSVREADCSLTPHIVDHIDLRQFAKMNEKT